MFCNDDHPLDTASGNFNSSQNPSRREIVELRESVFGTEVDNHIAVARPRELIIRHIPCVANNGPERGAIHDGSSGQITTALIVEAKTRTAVDDLVDYWLSTLDRLTAGNCQTDPRLSGRLCEEFLKRVRRLSESSSLKKADISASLVVVAWPQIEVIHGGRNLFYLYRSGCLTKWTAAPFRRSDGGVELQPLALPAAHRDLSGGTRCILATEGLAQLLSIDELQQFFMRHEHLDAEQACRRLANMAAKKSQATAFSLAVLGGKKRGSQKPRPNRN